MYAVMRFIVHAGLADPDSWYADVCNGYYGEEIAGVSSEIPDIMNKVNQFILDNRYLSNTEKIRNALIAEYGYILEALEGKGLDNIEKVAVEDIRFGSPDHYTRIDRKGIEKFYADYEDYDLPFGICIDEGNGKYRLIDGYHRVTYAKIKKLSEVPMIVVK
jgi:hypothetical protein